MNVSNDLAKSLAGRMTAVVAWALLLIVAFTGVGWATVSATYLLHGGDQLNVVVYGDQTESGPVTVLPDGDIDLPLVGKVHVGGQTPEQAAQTISKALQKYVRHPVVTVAVTQPGPLNVLVLGNVKTPGKYPLASTSNLTDAIAAAGGIGPTDGPYPDARIATPNGTPMRVSLQKLLHDGDTSLNVPLQDGDMVYIPAPITFNVEVVGSVDHPGQIQLNEGDRLTMAIAKAGNTAGSGADLNNINVTRTLPDGKTTALHINLYKELEGGDVSKDLVMQKDDIVYVPQVKNKGGGGLIGQSLFYIISSLRLLFP